MVLISQPSGCILPGFSDFTSIKFKNDDRGGGNNDASDSIFNHKLQLL
jgi:hypothetical protein